MKGYITETQDISKWKERQKKRLSVYQAGIKAYINGEKKAEGGKNA